MCVHRNRTRMPLFCTYIGWGFVKSAHWHADGAGSVTDGAGSAVDGAGSILEPKPAPPEQRRGPIRGAGSAPVLEPAPSSPGAAGVYEGAEHPVE